jgi:hypothetical protein
VPTYQLTPTDRAAAPASYPIEPRYLGYRAADQTRPYAKYFRPDALPMQPHVAEALLTGMAPTEYGYGVSEAARRLSAPGYHKMETGWTRLDDGTVVVACLTDMPGVTGEMWDWWMAWHSCESARYKLWHPDSHQYSAVAQNRLADRSLTDRERYVGNVSYVDEYVGGVLTPLAIRFVAPTTLGFEDPRPGETVIAGRVGLSVAPVAFGWLTHQVRATSNGAQMRSRFFLDHPEHLELPGEAVATPPPGRAPLGEADPTSLGVALLSHCAVEMNHLASFLPELYEEFAEPTRRLP